MQRHAHGCLDDRLDVHRLQRHILARQRPQTAHDLANTVCAEPRLTDHIEQFAQSDRRRLARQRAQFLQCQIEVAEHERERIVDLVPNAGNERAGCHQSLLLRQAFSGVPERGEIVKRRHDLAHSVAVSLQRQGVDGDPRQ